MSNNYEKKVRRVLVVNDFEEGGGAEVVALEGTKKFRQYKSAVQVQILVAAKNRDAVSGFSGFLANPRFCRKLIREIRVFRPDVIHVHNFTAACSPAIFLIFRIMRRRRDFRVVHTAHDFHLVCPNTGLIKYSVDAPVPCERCVSTRTWTNVFRYNCDRRGVFWSFARMARHIIFYSIFQIQGDIDHVIGPSQYLVDRLVKTYPELSVVLVRNTSFLSRDFSPQKRDITGPVLGYFGRLQKEKSVLDYLSTRYDPQEYPLFVIVGDGYERQEIKDFVAKQGLDRHVRVLGRKSQRAVATLYDQIDAVLLWSIYPENSPLSVIDAIAKRKTIVSRGKGGVQELVGLDAVEVEELLSTERYVNELEAVFSKSQKF